MAIPEVVDNIKRFLLGVGFTPRNIHEIRYGYDER